MNTKSFYHLAGAALIGLTFAACSQSNDYALENTAPQQPTEAEGPCEYTMTLNCGAPDYEDTPETRAVTYTDWDNGAIIYARFRSSTGSYVTGTATYNKSKAEWTVTASSSLGTTSSTCELYYFQGAGSTSGTTVNLNENTAIFYTTSATYTSQGTSVSVNAILNRMTWRLRFSGSSYTNITLPASSNEIEYYTSFNRDNGTFTKSSKDVSLSVASDKYTPYIYGVFKNSGTNRITVTSDATYYRDLSASNLKVGDSGVLTIPTASNYSSYKWTKDNGGGGTFDPNCTINITDYFITFTDGMVCEWELGSTVYDFDYTVFTKAGAEALTDDELFDEIYDDGSPYGLEYKDYNFKSTNSDWYKQNTQYYLCAAARNSSGKRGPVLRHLFTTRSESMPYAQVSNIKAASTTKWTYDIALKNNASKYYLATNTSEDTYNKDWHWYAANVYYWAITNQLEDQPYDWTSVQTTLNSGTCKYITICTWGVSSSNQIGNANVAYGSTSSSRQQAPAITPLRHPAKEVMSKQEMQNMRDNTTVYTLGQ